MSNMDDDQALSELKNRIGSLKEQRANLMSDLIGERK